MAPTRTTQNSLCNAGLMSMQRDPTPIVNTFTSFSQRHASISGPAQSISELMNHRHPETPTHTPSGLAPDNEDPDNEDDDTPGRNPPNDEGGDLDDEPDHDEDDGLNAQDCIFMQLSEAINNLARNNRCTSFLDDSKVKVCELDTFDGSEPRKLCAFFVQCKLNFQGKPKTFHSDWAKVNFAQSYLKGMALEWFEPDLLSGGLSSHLDWMDDYSEFMLELQTNFGPHDPSRDAEMQLKQLNMREGQCINKYIVEFQRLASQVHGWGDRALHRQFYNGLPARIKDEISCMGKSATLSEFKTLAQTIDAHYWEHKGEISRETKSSSSNPPKPSTSDRTSSHPSRSGNHSLCPYVSLPDYPSISEFPALVDCGSSHCFIETSLVRKQKLRTYLIPPIPLCLFDSTCNATISEAIDLSIHFSSGKVTSETFYITPLDSSCLIVLGYSWLSLHNPLIDWVTGSIDFWTTPHRMPSTPPTSPPLPDPIPTVEPHPPTLPEPSADNPVPNISLINAVAFCRACKLEGSTQFSIYLRPSRVDLHSAKLLSEGQDLSRVPSDYHEFVDVFNKGKASQLPPHHPYNLKIDLEEGSAPPLGTIYLLSPVELEALRKFLDENIATRLLCPSSSPHGAPVLFVKKKDGSLRLCMDFCGLNQITKKDQYPLPLISDLLESPSHTKIYMKIDLCSAHHLIQIASRDEWKTAFRMRYGSYEWLVMPEGLTNAPATFQWFVNSIFADMLDIYVIVYLDDIIIYSQDLASHKNHIQEVL